MSESRLLFFKSKIKNLYYPRLAQLSFLLGHSLGPKGQTIKFWWTWKDVRDGKTISNKKNYVFYEAASKYYSGGRISYLNSTEYTRSGLDRNSTALSPTLPPRTGARRKSGRQHYAISVEPWPSIPCRIQVGYASSTVESGKNGKKSIGSMCVNVKMVEVDVFHKKNVWGIAWKVRASKLRNLLEDK